MRDFYCLFYTPVFDDQYSSEISERSKIEEVRQILGTNPNVTYNTLEKELGVPNFMIFIDY